MLIFFEGATLNSPNPVDVASLSAFLFAPSNWPLLKDIARGGDGDFDVLVFPLGVRFGVPGWEESSGVPCRLDGKAKIPSERNLPARVFDVANSAWQVAWNIYRSHKIRSRFTRTDTPYP